MPFAFGIEAIRAIASGYGTISIQPSRSSLFLLGWESWSAQWPMAGCFWVDTEALVAPSKLLGRWLVPCISCLLTHGRSVNLPGGRYVSQAPGGLSTGALLGQWTHHSPVRCKVLSSAVDSNRCGHATGVMSFAAAEQVRKCFAQDLGPPNHQ